MMDWKPEVGDWVICLFENAKPFRLPENWAYTIIVRPAVLSDFAVEIEGYGKVWFVDEIYNNKSFITKWRKDELGIIWEGLSYIGAYDKWVLNALIAHYNITIMSEELWDKLKAEKGTDDGLD